MKKCEKCGKKINLKDWDFCEECLEKEKTLENCLLIGTYYDEEVEINGFWGFCFTDEKIEEILRSAFEKLPIEEKNDLVKKYCEYDMLYFVRYLKKNEKRKNCLFKR